jgi:rhodanese-related sulfurtransferase
MAKKSILTVIGATIAASLCCVTPVLAVLAGSSSLASSFSWLAPYHNYLVAFTVLVLTYAWYDKLKPSKDIECNCDESGFFSSKKFLAIVTAFTAVMLTFPQWGSKVFDSAPTSKSCSSGVCSINKPNKEEKKASTCTSGSTCSAPIKQESKTQDKKDLSTLPVLQYMSNEKSNPTSCGQVACSGTGFKELDDMMTQARKEVQEMSPAVLKKMLDNDEDLILIDVREAIQRAEGEIYASDSYAIPRTNLEFEILNKIKDKDAVIVLYSRQGARSLFAAQSIQKLGYKHVYNLSAGLKGWVRAEYPYDNGLGTVLKVVDAE